MKKYKQKKPFMVPNEIKLLHPVATKGPLSFSNKEQTSSYFVCIYLRYFNCRNQVCCAEKPL